LGHLVYETEYLFKRGTGYERRNKGEKKFIEILVDSVYSG
jgi:hypothetical protein